MQKLKNSKEKIKAGIFGGSGYGGGELLRILLTHPNVEVKFVTANEHAEKSVSDIHRNLYGLTSLKFITGAEAFENLAGIDVVFLSLPHGQAAGIVNRFPENIRIIDLSGDFRIIDPETHKLYYKFEHSGAAQREFIYGLTELNKKEIKTARLIANPGCFATATTLALAPLVTEGFYISRIVVDAKTGSSGSGAKPAANTHHPQRVNSFYAYKPFTHQHLPEIKQTLAELGSLDFSFVFMTHSLPVSRGIFASCYVESAKGRSEKALRELYEKFYRESPFIRIVEGSPDINWVKNTNFCDIGLATEGNQIAIFSAIDNLVKGAAGQAIQNMNLMFGLEETTGLIFTGSNP